MCILKAKNDIRAKNVFSPNDELMLIVLKGIYSVRVGLDITIFSYIHTIEKYIDWFRPHYPPAIQYFH